MVLPVEESQSKGEEVDPCITHCLRATEDMSGTEEKSMVGDPIKSLKKKEEAQEVQRKEPISETLKINTSVAASTGQFAQTKLEEEILSSIQPLPPERSPGAMMSTRLGSTQSQAGAYAVQSFRPEISSTQPESSTPANMSNGHNSEESEDGHQLVEAQLVVESAALDQDDVPVVQAVKHSDTSNGTRRCRALQAVAATTIIAILIAWLVIWMRSHFGGEESGSTEEMEDEETTLKKYRCFATRDELLRAANFYLYDDNSSDSDISRVFGHPIDSWCTRHVTSMNRIFQDAIDFNEDLSDWDLRSTTRLNGIFRNATSFNQDLASWDVSPVQHMMQIFAGSATFNQDLSSWNVARVTDLRFAFKNATQFSQDLCAWGKILPPTVNVTQMFRHTNCPNTSDPIIPTGPFCYNCHFN